MRETLNIVCVVAVVVGLSSTGWAAENLLAECGFNDAVGINADPTPDSPYTIGATIKGRGAAEPGWGGTAWHAGDDGANIGADLGKAEADDPFEGDAALRFRIGMFGETWAYRPWAPGITEPLLIEQYIRLPANGRFGSRPGRGGVGSLIAAGWSVRDGRFYVLDGDGQGGGTMEDTGILLRPMEWQKVATRIYPETKAYEFFVDDQKYDAPDPLDFRGDPGWIDRVDYLAQTDAWLDAVRVSVIPEPGALGLLAIGGLTMLCRRRR